MIFFTIATLLPVPLIAAAVLWGGVWMVVAFLSVTVLVGGLDGLIRRIEPAREDVEFPAANALSVTLVLAHFMLLPLVVWGFAADTLSWVGKLALWLTAGIYFGQVSNSNAHELIHKSQRWLHHLGMWTYTSMLFGHHTSAHMLIHHRYVATQMDPNSARLGEGFYRYARRAWLGSFREGYAAEKARLDRVGGGLLDNPYVTYLAGGMIALVLAIYIGGIAGLIGFVAVALNAQLQLLLSDYVQHYGLHRSMRGDKPEPIGPQHSWNSPHWYSSAFMLNAPRHSDHHSHPGRAFPALNVPKDAPMLPRSIPIMATIALAPPLWRRVMDKRARKWAA